MKKLSLKKVTLRNLSTDQHANVRGGFATTDGQTQSCANTCGCPPPPGPSGHWSCLASCAVCFNTL